MHVFLSEKMSRNDIEKASRALKKFVLPIENFYPETAMKYNVHLLLHFKENIQNFGALWAWSTFPYEDYNFTLRQMIFSSQSVMNQICKAYLRLQSIKKRDTFQKFDCSSQGQKLFEHYTNKLKSSKNCIFFENLRVISRSKELLLSIIQHTTIQAFLQEDINENAESFDRFIVNGIMFHSANYTRMLKQNNRIAEIDSKKYFAVEHLLLIHTLDREGKYVVIGKQ